MKETSLNCLHCWCGSSVHCYLIFPHFKTQISVSKQTFVFEKFIIKLYSFIGLHCSTYQMTKVKVQSLNCGEMYVGEIRLLRQRMINTKQDEWDISGSDIIGYRLGLDF